MVPYTIAGEKVRAKVTKRYTRYVVATPVEVITPSPHRVKPVCPYFTQCSGCQYQHMDYEEQLRLKHEHVVTMLSQMHPTHSFTVNPVIPSPLEYGYRSKITPHFELPADLTSTMVFAKKVSDRRKVTKDPGEKKVSYRLPPIPAPHQAAVTAAKPRYIVPIGFYHTYDKTTIIDVKECPVAVKKINEMLPLTRHNIREQIKYRDMTRNSRDFCRGGSILFRGWRSSEDQPDQDRVTLDEDDEISEFVNGYKFLFRAGDFWQTNVVLLPQLVSYVVEQAASQGDVNLVDTYCGVGLFAINAASHFTKVWGIDVSESMIAHATRNARRNYIDNCEFVHGQSKMIFQAVKTLVPRETAMIVDPPREGCDADFLAQLVQYAPHTLIYVSCSPITQARDLAILFKAKYIIAAIQPFDMFPQNRHLETVITLVKRFPSARSNLIRDSTPKRKKIHHVNFPQMHLKDAGPFIDVESLMRDHSVVALKSGKDQELPDDFLDDCERPEDEFLDDLEKK